MGKSFRYYLAHDPFPVQSSMMVADTSYGHGGVVFWDDRVGSVWPDGVSAVWNLPEGIADKGSVRGLLRGLVSLLLILRVISLVVG